MPKRQDNLKELRNLGLADLERRIKDLHEKLRDLAFKTRGDEIRNVHQMRAHKRQIARALTILKEKRNISR